MKITSLFLIGLMLVSTMSSASQNGTVRWTTKDDAGVFFDHRPNERYVEHNSRACVKDQFTKTVNGETRRVMKVRCRQPNGKFAYIW